MAVVWERSGDAFFAIVDHGTDRYYLTAEELSGGGWDWSAWSQRYGWRIVRNGIADTVQEAMRNAEQALT
jgi:hypothetical protein